MTAVILESFLDMSEINSTEELVRDAHIRGFDEGFLAGQTSVQNTEKDRLEQLLQKVLAALSDHADLSHDIREALTQHMGNVLQHVLGEILPHAVAIGIVTRLQETLAALAAMGLETRLLCHPDNLKGIRALNLHEKFQLTYEPCQEMALGDVRLRHAEQEQSLNADHIRLCLQDLLQTHLLLDRTAPHEY